MARWDENLKTLDVAGLQNLFGDELADTRGLRRELAGQFMAPQRR